MAATLGRGLPEEEGLIPRCCGWEADIRWQMLKSQEVLESTRIDEDPLAAHCSPQDKRSPAHLVPLPVLHVSEPGQKTLYQPYKGQLQLSVYINCGLITVHVISARHLTSSRKPTCDAYVKVSLIPDDDSKARCRTDVIRDSNHPLFDEKFSFELLEEDYNKRLFLSLWHCDIVGKQGSELIGCMSFGIKGIRHREQNVKGWYYLLSDYIGKGKHLAVADSNQTPPSQVTMVPTSRESSLEEEQGTTDLRVHDLDVTPTHAEEEEPNLVRKKLTMRRGSHGYGLRLTGASPAEVSRVEPLSGADLCGVKVGDLVVAVNGEKVHRFSCDTVGRIIRHYPKVVLIDVLRAESTAEQSARKKSLQYSSRRLQYSTPRPTVHHSSPWQQLRTPVHHASPWQQLESSDSDSSDEECIVRQPSRKRRCCRAVTFCQSQWKKLKVSTLEAEF